MFEITALCHVAFDSSGTATAQPITSLPRAPLFFPGPISARSRNKQDLVRERSLRSSAILDATKEDESARSDFEEKVRAKKSFFNAPRYQVLSYVDSATRGRRHGQEEPVIVR